MILEKLDRFPPFLVRLLARRPRGQGWKPLSTTEIAGRAELSRYEVQKISALTTWASVPVEIVERFANGCRVDLSKGSELRKILRLNKLSHLRFSNVAQRKFFAALMSSKSGSKSSADSSACP